MRYFLAIWIGKLISVISQRIGFGAGATWPGEVALAIAPEILSNFAAKFKHGVILVAGTNGKTTTSLMIKKILAQQGLSTVHNNSGANLLNGVVSACIQKASWTGSINADWGIFEVDENSLPAVISNIQFPRSLPRRQASNNPIEEKKKFIIVLLNLFRDQLDRYGEVDVIAEKWGMALKKIDEHATVILNADDPLVAYLGKDLKSTIYFGIEDRKQFLNVQEHATDSTFCRECGARLIYDGIYFSHLGVWKCTKCGNQRPKSDISVWRSPLPGLYNLYNTLAAVGTTQSIGIKKSVIEAALVNFKPAFGRQEEFVMSNKKIKLFLSKNPAGFNASLRTVLEQKPKALLYVLNDRIPDGKDVSWIWDVDFETIPEKTSIFVSGDRVYDMGLRIKYSKNSPISNYPIIQLSNKNRKSKIQNTKYQIQNTIIEPNLSKAIQKGLEEIEKGETLYILATYSAMLEVRKILTGKKIL